MERHDFLSDEWTDEQALVILAFLDELSNVIWKTYGPHLTKSRRCRCRPNLVSLPPDHDDPF